MRAIIIAAGMGKRLLPLTKDRPKCMLEIGGKSLIERQLDTFREIGIHDVSIVTGYLGETLRFASTKTYFNRNYETNNILLSLMCAAAELVDDVVITYSDIIFEKNIIEKLLAADGDFLLVTEEDWEKSYAGRNLHPVAQAEKVVAEKGVVRKIGKYLSAIEAHGEFIGLARFSKRGAQIFRAVAQDVALKFAGRPFQHANVVENAYLTDLFQELIDQGEKITAVTIHGGWMEIDTIEDFLKACEVYADPVSSESTERLRSH